MFIEAEVDARSLSRKRLGESKGGGQEKDTLTGVSLHFEFLFVTDSNYTP
jgi:hypothetical protein